MYSVLNFGHMAADGVRMDAYARAIQRAVKPDSVVLDIGAGTGILSLLAAKAGARRVHAVDPNPAIWLLPDLARENGVADRIEIHHSTSYELSLAEKADVILSDLRGSAPTHGAHLAVLRDAKARLLKPGGVLVPARDELHVAIFEHDEMTAGLERGCKGFTSRGLSADAVRRSILNTPLTDNRQLRASDLLTTAAPWSTITYGVEQAPLEGDVELLPRRRGMAHGLAIWFSATILDEIGFSTEPGMSMVYSRVILPLVDPFEIDHGDSIRVLVRVSDDGQRWAWETERTRAGVTKKSRQSSFFGMPTSPELLLKASPSYTPSLSIAGERAKRILASMDGNATVSAIADGVATSAEAANLPTGAILEEVQDLTNRYGR
jgi:type I protein arginine methyltransferase